MARALVLWLYLRVAAVVADADAPWYEGIDSITVVSPTDDGLQEKLDSIWQMMSEDAHGNASAFQKGQFGKRRHAVLLRKGAYPDLQVAVNWYTSVLGVGLGAKDVTIKGLTSQDAYPGSAKGCLENFWKSAEGVTTLENDTLWAVSQAAPLRRSVITGNLALSELPWLHTQDGAHYASGGFLADVSVQGTLNWGSQQQFFFRNSEFHKVNYTGSGQSMVFVGVEGAPVYNTSLPKPLMSTVDKAPRVAEKPYLVELEAGDWRIAVSAVERDVSGRSSKSPQTLISLSDVFIAKEGDTAEKIQAGIEGKRGLLFTPAIYGLDSPVYISSPDFVVLGIGMATLVATRGHSTLIVSPGASNVRMAGLLIEAGMPNVVDATEPLLTWKGSGGVASDIFGRVGAFSYETDFHPSCLLTRADVMFRIDGDDMTVDNAWLWHADHDDCTGYQGQPQDGELPKSDECFSKTGLVVNGNNVVTYGLAVEHTKHDLVQWDGENGQVFFFQSELPYRSNLDFGKDGYVGYKVGYGVEKHLGYGVGVYQVFNTYTMNVSMRLPSTANMTNIFTWCITGNRSGLGHLACTGPGLEECIAGDCDGNSCQLLNSSNFTRAARHARKSDPMPVRFVV
jgi:hypothetical protein